MRLKVSNVCQLLDKSKYPATITNNGVTFTNNGDGTITLNGTNTGGGSNLYTFMKVSVKAGHYYYIYSGQAGTWGTCMFTVDRSISADKIDGYIGFQGAHSFDNCAAYLFIGEGATFNNYVVKPQFFDLTEMYGAGNEPTTVAQFRQDFPNEMYEYSPVCWKKFRRLKYVTETKNLFDMHNLTAYTPETLPHGTAGVYNGVIISRGRIDDTTCSTGKTLRQLCPDLIAGETYTLNFETTVPSSVGGQYESIHLRGSGNWWRRNRKIITESDLSAVVYIYAETDGAVYMTYNLQIEKGSTATPYQPYGYLPLNRGKYIANKEPVQLLDKSKYPPTGTSNGITYTKNEDGSYDVNGTVTKNGLSTYLIGTAELKKNHIYLNNSRPGTVANSQKSYVECKMYYRSEGKWIFPAARFKCGLDDAYAQITLLVNQTAGTVISNEKLYPELFDLTEMYGAGNEPTAEEFWATHPKTTMYDYNPYNAITFR